MKILYLTPAWFGFDKIIYDGAEEITGLPSFSYPLKELVESGHTIDMVVIYTSSERDLNFKLDWVKKINFLCQFKYDLRLPWKIFSILKYRSYIKKLIDSNKYDFVYVHGSSPSVANDLISKKGIPIGQRLYGTFLWDKIKSQGLFRTKIKHLVEYLSFKTKKSFLLVTDDGSGANKVVDELFIKKCTPYDFFYWKNGVSRLLIEESYEQEFNFKKLPEKPFIFYCARFDAWKRQERLIDILKALSDQSIDINVVFAGPFDTLGDDYYNHVRKYADDLGVLESCIFLGSVSKQDIYLYNKYALASLSLYDVCNVTSVFHEMMASGALIIVRDDLDVREFIKTGENGFLVNSNDECVSLVKDILLDSHSYENIRVNAVKTSHEMTPDWSLRSSREVKLIESYVSNVKG